jgi:hypothetical protein
VFTVSIATLGWLMAANGAAPRADAGGRPAPFPPSSFRDPSELARNGYEILAKTTGDVDGDGRPNLAVVHVAQIGPQLRVGDVRVAGAQRHERPVDGRSRLSSKESSRSPDAVHF